MPHHRSAPCRLRKWSGASRDGRRKQETCRPGCRPCGPCIGCAGGVAGVRDQGDPTVLGQSAQGVIVGRLSGIIDRHDGAGFRRYLACATETWDRSAMCRASISAKTGTGAFINRGIGAGGKGDGWHDHLVARVSIRIARIAAMQGGGSGVDRNAFLGTAPGLRKAFSNSETRGPVVSQPEQSASTTALTSASANFLSCRRAGTGQGWRYPVRDGQA